jgi:uncharacterized protein (DUF433 family)
MTGEVTMPATMHIIVSEGRDRGIYPGAAPVKVSGALPEYRGGVTMTIRFAPKMEPTPVARITVDPQVRGGVPCVSDGRWPIAHILEKLASGLTVERVMRDYPDLTLVDIQLALEAAAWVMRDPAINWSELNLPGMVDFQREMRAWQSLSDDTLGLIDDSSRD